MNQFQQTLLRSITFSGHGLHTGLDSFMTLIPAQPGSGITFQRMDIDGKPEIPAHLSFVENTHRSTNLQKLGVKIKTVEHILASLAGWQIDNVLIQLHGEEIPILDGSALDFSNQITKAGVVVQPALKEYYELVEPVYFISENGGEYIAHPSSSYQLETVLDYEGTILDKMTGTFSFDDSFETKIAPCRTFCFEHEVALLQKEGLIKGGDLNNALVISSNDTSNWRFDNEPAQHKILDSLGDFSLLGKPLKAHIKSRKPGHTSNIAFAKYLLTVLKERETFARH